MSHLKSVSGILVVTVFLALGVSTASAAPPENTALPVITPSTPPLENVPVSTSNGSWANTPTSFTYQWLRCNKLGTKCVTIPGATKSTYAPDEADVESTLRAAVTAKNAEGEATAQSEATGVVLGAGGITEFSLAAESEPTEIIRGPDNNLWFIYNEAAKVGKMTTAGSLTDYSIPNGEWLDDLVSGPGGNVWYSIGYPFLAGKITPAGETTNYSLAYGNPYSIGVDASNQLWVTISSRRIAKMQSTGTVSAYYSTAKDVTPQYITQGAEGKMWFANKDCGYVSPGRCAIGKISNEGVITEYNVTGVPHGLTLGPDGNMWFTLQWWSESKVGKITPTGTITTYALPTNSEPERIVPGPDGSLWFAQRETDKIARVTTSGAIEEFPLPEGSEPVGVAVGPDNYIWYTAAGTGKIGKIVP